MPRTDRKRTSKFQGRDAGDINEELAPAWLGPSPDPLDEDGAAAGIEEFIIEFLPGLLGQQATGVLSGHTSPSRH